MKEQMVRRVIMILYRLCAPTWRIIEEYVEGEAADVRRILNGETPASVLFAHGKMFPLWYHLRSTNGAPVISLSSDGERLAWVLRHALGYRRIIRGSSSSGGAEVLEALERTLAAQSTLMTPDGPRGPRNEPKAGGIVAAYRSGRNILVVTCSMKRAIRLDTWDRMEIPFPFSQVYVRYCTISTPTTTDEITSTIDAVRRILQDDQPRMK